MTTPIEEFTIALAKASKRTMRTLRRVRREVREDIIATALLWCWEHREEFNPADETLESWFATRVDYARRTVAYQEQHEGERRVRLDIEKLDVLSRHSSGAPLPASDSSTRPWSTISRPPIDHEIEKMLNGPRVGMKDCPPCWRCMYFEGWTPNLERYKPPTHVADPEIQKALQETEARKIKIGQGERA